MDTLFLVLLGCLIAIAGFILGFTLTGWTRKETNDMHWRCGYLMGLSKSLDVAMKLEPMDARTVTLHIREIHQAIDATHEEWKEEYLNAVETTERFEGADSGNGAVRER